MNWRGRPLPSHQVIVDLIAATTTRTGLKVHAELDTSTYPTGINISDHQMAALPITRHDFHGEWNYTLKPARSPCQRVVHWQAPIAEQVRHHKRERAREASDGVATSPGTRRPAS